MCFQISSFDFEREHLALMYRLTENHKNSAERSQVSSLSFPPVIVSLTFVTFLFSLPPSSVSVKNVLRRGVIFFFLKIFFDGNINVLEEKYTPQ